MPWESASELAPRLFREAKSLLSMALLDVPQSRAFFQAAVILSMWSTTIGQTPLSIDSWLLSGFALQHSFASEIYAPIPSGTRSISMSKTELDHRCIWNHLCLAHLQYTPQTPNNSFKANISSYCVGTRRKAILNRHQVDECREILATDQITNFETRMVAEINLYWIIYESCSTAQVDLPGTQDSLHGWRQKWEFLFGESASFVDETLLTLS